MTIAQGSPIQSSRRTVKRRSKPSADGGTQPMRTTLPGQVLPAKVSKGRVALATTSDRPTETKEQRRPESPRPTMVEPNTTPTFSGNFDLYGMYLPSLAKLCFPPGATTPGYAAIYDRILASQAKHDYTARCYLAPIDAPLSAPYDGRFECASVLDPMTERPFDITLHSFTYHRSLAFSPADLSSFQAPEHSVPGPGVVGHTGLPSDRGIKTAKGVFKIKRTWAKEQDGLFKELFEGIFSFSVSYDNTYQKAGHSNGAR